MNINCIKVGKLQTNCYILENDRNVLIIDPGDEANKIRNEIKDKNVVGIIITHYHFDHIGALDELQREYNTTIYDYKNLNEGTNKIANFTFEMIKTPGHKEDLISIYFEEEQIMFVGDFIFKGTIGRTDLEGGNPLDMQKSLEKIKKYPKEIIIYPGHGDKTTLEEEMKYNKYLKNEV